MIAANDDSPKAALARRRRRRLERWIMDTTGSEWCGNSSPPRQTRKLYVYDDGVYRVFSMEDDGGSVGIGYPNEWQVFMRWEAARMFAWWVLRTWATDWFGLRSHIWYMALHRSVAKEWKLRPYPRRKFAWRSSYDAWWIAEAVGRDG